MLPVIKSVGVKPMGSLSLENLKLIFDVKKKDANDGVEAIIKASPQDSEVDKLTKKVSFL